jgi:hypothetical protein
MWRCLKISFERCSRKLVAQRGKDAKITQRRRKYDGFQVMIKIVGTWYRMDIFSVYILEPLVTQGFNLACFVLEAFTTLGPSTIVTELIIAGVIG